MRSADITVDGRVVGWIETEIYEGPVNLPPQGSVLFGNRGAPNEKEPTFRRGVGPGSNFYGRHGPIFRHGIGPGTERSVPHEGRIASPPKSDEGHPAPVPHHEDKDIPRPEEPAIPHEEKGSPKPDDGNKQEKPSTPEEEKKSPTSPPEEPRHGGKPVYGGSDDVNVAIQDAAKESGVSPRTMKAIASIESNLKPDSNYNKDTQYKGLYQIGRSEWAKYGQGDIYNAHDNAMAAGRMFKDHIDEFHRRFGRDPTDEELYMIHQQGMGFFTRGSMTNIQGNRFPGMHGTPTHDEFMHGWGAELERRKGWFGDTPEVAVQPNDQVHEGKGGITSGPGVPNAAPRDLDDTNRSGHAAPITGTIGRGVGATPSASATGHHQGVDILAPHGSPVYAPQGGTIVKSDDQSPSIAGQVMTLKADDGTYYKFLHLSGRDYKVGDRVDQGQEIGHSGTANSVSHLHFEHWSAGDYPSGRDESRLIDPEQEYGWRSGQHITAGGGTPRVATPAERNQGTQGLGYGNTQQRDYRVNTTPRHISVDDINSALHIAKND